MRALHRRSRQRRSFAPAPPPAWRRDVRLLATSRGISMAGAEAGHIALLALAWHLTGSASDASLVLLAAVAARTIGAPLAGWIGDHLDRRRVIIGSELAVAATLVGLAMSGSMTELLVWSALHAFAASTCGAALDAAVGGLVPAGDLPRANSTIGMARTTGHMLGPVLGGMAVAAWGAQAAFLLDAASSVIAAACVVGIRGCVGGSAARLADPRAAIAHADRGPLAGMRVLSNDPILRLLVAGWAGLCVCFAFVTAAELPLAVEFGVDEPGLGAIVSAWCFGSLVGAWMARRVDLARRGAAVLAVNAIVCAAVFAATGIAPAFWCVLVLMTIGGYAMSLAEVVEMSLIQQRVDDDVRARVMAAYQGLFSAIWGSNLALAGVFIDAFSPGAAYVYAGAWCLVGAVGFTALARRERADHLASTLRILRPRHALESELSESA